MSKLIPIIYMIGVLLLVLPAFIHTNRNLKIFFTNLSIWVAIILVKMAIFWKFQIYVEKLSCV